MNRQFPAMSGLAMLLIVINHTIEMGTGVPARAGFPSLEGGIRTVLSLIQGFGIFAVPTFLFISGTFISYAARGEPPRLSFKFLRGSVSHIWWPYLLWSMIFYGLVLLQFGESYTLRGYAKNLVVGYPYHFIPLLLIFYLLSPLLVKWGKDHAVLMLVAIAGYQVFLLLQINTELFPKMFEILVPPAVRTTLADWAIYFPLGLVYGLHMRTLLPWLKKLRVLLVVSIIGLFILAALHYMRVLTLPVAGSLSSLAFVLLLPVIQRQSIPLVRLLERIGKRSYGLYLTHLIVLDLTLLCIGTLWPMLFKYQLALLPLLFLIALAIPMFLMQQLAASRLRSIYRYVLG